MRYKGIIKIVLITYLIFDVGFSFFQHYNSSLDGDLPNIVLPSESYRQVLKSPFGLEALLNQKTYAGPNRYFSHAVEYYAFQYFPHVLQKLVSPVVSVFLTAAIIKIIVQILLYLVLTLYITLFTNRTWLNILTVAAIISPFFQIRGFVRTMGIIDPSITYTTFYALPLLLILLSFYPLIKLCLSNHLILYL